MNLSLETQACLEKSFGFKFQILKFKIKILFCDKGLFG